ncbi:hypothetical protein [Leadbettera azotonutricia]|uniref:hypothetical protein n=1 Tax=Leadbettera azotonutricia TaxID=150829 RepID=UPI001FDF5FB3|nr:hypothetical protein [Leadbettera azotonutricia]
MVVFFAGFLGSFWTLAKFLLFAKGEDERGMNKWLLLAVAILISPVLLVYRLIKGIIRIVNTNGDIKFVSQMADEIKGINDIHILIEKTDKLLEYCNNVDRILEAEDSSFWNRY